ncbi:DUF4352 domain-containing protein [Proteinivorax tanatarense]|uniref:DUF4352 domain-containing protein n=1 Tax=Proteinivorax tanatarense TaxID=1260629 RepID=A0AAU7VNX5_9FIRM
MKKFFILMLSFALLFFIVGCGDSQPEKVTDTEAQVEQEDDDKEESEKAQSETFAIGDSVEIADVVFTVHSARWDDGDDFFGPEDGEKWLVLDCSIDNETDESEQISSLLMFELVDEDNYKRDLELLADTKGSLDGELGAGRSMRGEIAFSVDEGQSKWELIFAPNVFGTGQAIFEIDKSDVQ